VIVRNYLGWGCHTTNFAEVYNFVRSRFKSSSSSWNYCSLCITQCDIFTKGERQQMMLWGIIKWCTAWEWPSIWRNLRKKHLFTRSERSLTTSLMRVKKLWKYEVKCKGKMCLGPSHEKTQQMCELGNQICRCSCRKPQLLHTPCTHVITVCYEIQNFIHRRYVPWYYEKETVRNTWNWTIEDYLVRGTFTKDPQAKFCVHTRSRSRYVPRCWKTEEEED
jgi:hypothetical protein